MEGPGGCLSCKVGIQTMNEWIRHVNNRGKPADGSEGLFLPPEFLNSQFLNMKE